MAEVKVKKAIKLPQDVVEDYSIGSESLWFLEEGETYRLINIPFFIENLSMEDSVILIPLDNGLYSIESIVSKSGNSTIWITLNDDQIANSLTENVHNLGCGLEGGVLHGYYAINVPSEINIEKIFEVLDREQRLGKLNIYYASERH